MMHMIHDMSDYHSIEDQTHDAVVAALRAADLGLNPLVEKNMVRIPIPK